MQYCYIGLPKKLSGSREHGFWIKELYSWGYVVTKTNRLINNSHLTYFQNIILQGVVHC